MTDLEHKLDEMVELVYAKLLDKINETNLTDDTIKTKDEDILTYGFIGDNLDSGICEVFDEHGYIYKDLREGHLVEELIICQLPFLSLPRLAQLLAVNEEERIILEHLNHDKNIILLKSGLPLLNRINNRHLRIKYQGYVNELSRLGIKIQDRVSQNQFKDIKISSSERLPIKKLITYEDVQKMDFPSNTLVVNPKVIITALAQDYLKTKQIKIERRV
ncbi:hypothetical protein CL176_08805 [Suicoccus acidiformans]|uniref:Ethanolamine utilization protein n=1 Tax=Suicoccus acidiformans TaxID=2036206 RepID=A0A347WLY4_9LACT|nr:hypothetical protein [Suicoccus acidiformans]AXY26091.1 hypothetical protein CL176_08805 [Suicoccus acidiformans]